MTSCQHQEDPLAALRFMGEEWVVWDVSVRRIRADWEARIKAQSDDSFPSSIKHYQPSNTTTRQPSTSELDTAGKSQTHDKQGAAMIIRFKLPAISKEDIRPRTERMQLLAESKTKQELEKRIDFVQRLSKYSKSELQAILKKLDGDLQGEREGVQQSRMEESGDDTQSRTEKIQLVVESKTQLRPLLKRMNFMDRLMTDSKSELQAIMTKSEGDLQGEREGMQQSEMKGSEDDTRSGTERQQLVAESKTKLEHLVKRMNFVRKLVKDRKSKLKAIIKKYERDLQGEREWVQQSGMKGTEESEGHGEQGEIGCGSGEKENNEKQTEQSDGKGCGSQNDSEELRFVNDDDANKKLSSERKLRILLDIEEHMRMLRHNEDGKRLWEEISMRVRQWWLADCKTEQGEYLLEDWWQTDEEDSLDDKTDDDEENEDLTDFLDHSLVMMWESNDSVWLLGFCLCGRKHIWFPQEFWNIMQQIHLTEFPKECYPRTLAGRKQLFSIFENKLLQWKDRTDFLQTRYKDMEYMLENWPDHCKQNVMSTSHRKLLRTQSTSYLDKAEHIISWGPQLLPIHKSKSESHLQSVVSDGVFSIAVEVAFPQCAIIRLAERDAVRNHGVLSFLGSGSHYAGLGTGQIIAGSRGEGVAVEKGWGHPLADQDLMELYGGPLTVHVPQGRHPSGRPTLRYRPEGCPPAYCKIEVTDIQEVMEVMGGRLDAGCVHRINGLNWLHTRKTLMLIQSNREVSGPAGQIRGGLHELIPALVCSDAHPDMDQNYLNRPRHGWPSPRQLKVIRQFPMLLVFTGHKLSHADEIPLQARLSWSHSEMELIITLPLHIKQMYIALKYAFKRLIKKFRGTKTAADGRSTVGSFYLKTTFLRHLERRPPIMIRSQLDLMFGLLYDLDGYLMKGNLPHYFLPACNLLATVGPEERRLARDVIQHILSDPVRAILTCPTRPCEIYGKVRPDALVAAFHQVSSDPTCVRNHEHLLWLLRRLDKTRRERYQRQQESDERQWERVKWQLARDDRKWCTVSGRPALRGLVDML